MKAIFSRASLTAPLRSRFLVAGLLSVIAVFQLQSVTPGHDWGDDFAMYIAHARNLVQGRPYSDTGYIYNPEEPIGPPRAPPGLPILLAPIYAVRGADLVAMKMLIVVGFIGALAVLALLAERWDSRATAFTVTALVGFHPFFRDFKNQIFSDLPFLFFFLLSIWLAEQSLIVRPGRSTTFRTGIILGVVWAASYATRTAGAVLPLALVATELLTQRRLQRSTIVALAVFALSAMLQSIWLQDPSDYLVHSAYHPAVIISNAAAYAGSFRGLLDTGFSARGTRALFAIANVFVVAGFIRSWMKGQRLPAITSLLYLGGALLWPVNAGVRYLIPLIPFYLFYGVVGIRLLDERLLRQRHVIALSAAGLALAVYGGLYYQSMRTPWYPRIDNANARSLFRFVRASTPSTAVIIFKKPRALALYTGRRGAIYTTSEHRHPWQFIEKIGATFIVTIRRSAQDSVYVTDLEMERPHSLAEVFANGEFVVYRLSSARRAGFLARGLMCTSPEVMECTYGTASMRR
jgi:4-amino-4-deoxy-L-arabinose transferase-like glycosyltransferase